jgi:hypothetical protein
MEGGYTHTYRNSQAVSEEYECVVRERWFANDDFNDCVGYAYEQGIAVGY